LIARDGTESGIEDTAAPIRNAAGEILGAVMVFHDVTAHRHMSGELTFQATHDFLTGLVNRGEFERRLRKVLANERPDSRENALLYIDLDQFKLVNDACGYTIGDQLLRQVSELLGAVVRASDTLARLGGDEFGLILEQCSMHRAQQVGQEICDLMDDFRFTHDGRRFRIGASVGLVQVDGRWPTTEALLQAADASCYAAKDAGRNRVHTWFDTDQAMHARHGEVQWTTRIEQALDEGSFVLYGQRILPINSDPYGEHAEVLLRMTTPDGTLVSPAVFMPAAERFNMASRIDRWVVSNSILWVSELPNLELLKNLSINLSGQSIGDRAFQRWVLGALEEAGYSICTRLTFEITETSAVTNLADARHFFVKVRSLGIRVALDDFGAGASSFGYLKNIQIDILKIDGQFVKNIVLERLDAAAVRCFVDIAKVIGVKTVAEYVESDAVFEQLRQMGVDYAQGYLLHQPEPLDRMMLNSSFAALAPA
jgi:diguanylate cyclase (GGDEF)-like protein